MSNNLNISSGRVCLVTGASRGIGNNIARVLGKSGFVLAISDVDSAGLERLRQELIDEGVKVEAFTADLSIRSQPKCLIDKILLHFGRLDVLINNARSGKRLSFECETESNWDLAFNVNLKAPFLLAQAAIPHMGINGCIVNISSVSGKFISQESPSYHLSKAALLQLTRYLAVYAGSKGVRVNAVLPGFIVQDEHRERYESLDSKQVEYREIVDFLHPLAGGPGFSDDVASAVRFLVSKEAKFITGQEIIVDGGLTIQDPAKVIFDFENKNNIERR